LKKFLPENLAKSVIAKDKARKQAENVLPKSASDKEIKDLTDLIYKQDLSDYKSGGYVNKENVFRQLKEDEQDMEAYKMLTDPYYKIAAFGLFDAEGNELIPGQLSLMSKAIDEDLEKKANNIPNSYFDSVISMGQQSQFGVNIMPVIRQIHDDG
jgi:hypothetical protein